MKPISGWKMNALTTATTIATTMPTMFATTSAMMAPTSKLFARIMPVTVPSTLPPMPMPTLKSAATRPQGRSSIGFIAGHFMSSPEWQSRYGSVDDATFVDLLYRHVLDRPADPEGSAYWQDQLRRGYPRTALVVSFSESAEHVSRTGTAPPEPPPPWPLAPASSGEGRRIVYGGSAQRVWLVDQYNLVVDTYLVSGRANTPAVGTYSVYSKSEQAWAGHDGITMRWMVRFAHGSDLAIGFHSIPRDASGRPLQSESQLGTYRSSGCVRQADHKAQFLYGWAPIGTKVVVLR